jgi:hypothetical protein
MELLPLQILYIFVSPLSAFGHNTSILFGWFIGSSPSSFPFVVGRQEIVKQKYKNVQRKTNK